MVSYHCITTSAPGCFNYVLIICCLFKFNFANNIDRQYCIFLQKNILETERIRCLPYLFPNPIKSLVQSMVLWTPSRNDLWSQSLSNAWYTPIISRQKIKKHKAVCKLFWLLSKRKKKYIFLPSIRVNVKYWFSLPIYILRKIHDISEIGKLSIVTISLVPSNWNQDLLKKINPKSGLWKWLQVLELFFF